MATLIIPDVGGPAQGHWQGWWLHNDPNAVLVEQDDWRAPSPVAWTQRLVEAVTAHPHAWLVAHGLGVPLLTRLAAVRLDLAIAGALLVAPVDVEDRRNPFEQLEAFEPMSLAPLPFPATLIASRSESGMRFARARSLAAAWGAELVDYGNSGRIDAAAGFGPWPDGPRLLAAVQARRRRRADRISPLNPRGSGPPALFVIGRGPHHPC